MDAALTAFSSRPLYDEDLPLIRGWSREMAVLFPHEPAADLSLGVQALRAQLSARSSSVVILLQGAPVAFGHFVRAEVHGCCTIGSVVVAPERRRQGIGRYLVDVLRQRARLRYHGRELRVACPSTNTGGLVFLASLGFEPCALESWPGPDDELQALLHFRQPLIPVG